MTTAPGPSANDASTVAAASSSDANPLASPFEAPAGDRVRTVFRFGLTIINALAALPFAWLFVGVVPKFERMFMSLGGKLPLLTQGVLTMSRFLVANLLALLAMYAAAIIVIALVRRVRRSDGILALATAHALALIALSVLAPYAIFLPILELQHTRDDGKAPAGGSTAPAESRSGR